MLRTSSNNRRDRGFALITMAFCIFVLLGFTGLAVDIGHLYIVKNEVQAFADAAALAAAQELDSTTTGTSAARTDATNTTNRFNFGTTTVPTVLVDFSLPDATGANNYTWVSNPNPASGYTMVRVRAAATVPLYFMPAVSAPTTSTVWASAVAGQIKVTSFKQGVFPFSPFAQTFNLAKTASNSLCGTPVTNGCVDSMTGLTVGQQYTLRWPSNPNPSNGNGNTNMCPGDNAAGQTMVDIANAAGGSERGFIEDTSASLIAQTIIDDLQSVNRVVGDLVTMTGGAKQSQLDSLQTRINQDQNTTAMDSGAYFSSSHNNRRIVACLINDGSLVNGNQYDTIQMGAFLLLPSAQYGNGGNQSWCAEYLGPYVQGGKRRGAGSDGAYIIKLVM